MCVRRCDQCSGDQFDIRLEHLGSVTAERGADRWLYHIDTFIIFEKKKKINQAGVQ